MKSLTINKKEFENEILNLSEKNFEFRNIYFPIENSLFKVLQPVVTEINKCLILELQYAAVTLTNNYLESLLKLSLIYNEIGSNVVPLEKWDEVFEIPHKKYSKINLSNSIGLCLENNLISVNEADFLNGAVRKIIRNGFSHADTDKILETAKDEGIIFSGDLENPATIKPFIIKKQKSVPQYQSLLIGDFVRQNSVNYFENIFEISRKIEIRIKSKAVNQVL